MAVKLGIPSAHARHCCAMVNREYSWTTYDFKVIWIAFKTLPRPFKESLDLCKQSSKTYKGLCYLPHNQSTVLPRQDQMG